MKDDKKSSVIKEALIEFNEIQEAADANAKKKLAKEFPENYKNLLKEELNKNKKTKESYKKLDETKESDDSDKKKSNKEESVMKNQKKETKKVIKEDDKNQPFDKNAPEIGPDVVKEEREKDFMGDIENDTPNLGKGETEKGDTFIEKITTKQDSIANDTTIKEEFNVTGLDANSVGSALENANAEDEIITMDEIEEEISSMNELETINTNPKSGSDDGIAYDKLVNMRNQIDEMIQGIGEQKNQGGKQSIPGRESGGPTTAMIDEEDVIEQKKHGGQGANKVNDGGPTTAMIDEEDEITDADVTAVLGNSAEGIDEQDVEEAHGMTYAERRKMPGRENPAPEYLSKGELDQSPEYVKESKKKIGSLINENKSLTKKLNETKKYKKSVTTLVEQYKSALDKYRTQLKEMATFNTNLAHVNNLLVNEGLALTQEDKIKIINEFKKVDTIADSQEKYKKILKEMKESKTTLTESIETKMSTSVAPSASKQIDEAKEVTVYADDKHIKKMKRLIEYIEKTRNRGQKII